MDLLHDCLEDMPQVYENCKISDGQPCLSCRGYVESQEQMVALRTSYAEQLQKVREQQRRLRTAINREHDLLVRALPSEVMERVFECYRDAQNSVEKRCEQVYNSCAPLILGAVSQSWRRIAWSSPQLWTHISVNYRGYKHQTCLEVAQECFSRSGQLPLSIEVSLYHPYLSVHREDIFYQVIELINRHSSRWQDLRVICRSELLPLFSGGPQGTPIIRKLFLENPFDTDNRVQEEGDIKFKVEGLKPQPTHVSLSNFGLQSLDIDWLRVTNVQLHKTTFDQFDQLLQQIPELMHCQLSCIPDAGRSYRYPAEIPIVHHTLRSLTIGKYQGKELGLFYSFPELTHLTIEHINDPESRVLLNSFVPLIERSLCQLTYLRLHNVVFSREEFIGLLRTTPSLRQLELSICKQILDILQLLADTSMIQSSEADAGHQDPFLPNLVSIRYSEPGMGFCIRGTDPRDFWLALRSRLPKAAAHKGRTFMSSGSLERPKTTDHDLQRSKCCCLFCRSVEARERFLSHTRQ